MSNLKKSTTFFLLLVVFAVSFFGSFVYAAQTINMTLAGGSVTISPSAVGSATDRFVYSGTLQVNKNSKIKLPPGGSSVRCNNITFTPPQQTFTSDRVFSFTYRGGEDDFNCDIVADDEQGNTSVVLNLTSSNKPTGVCLIVSLKDGMGGVNLANTVYSLKDGQRFENANCMPLNNTSRTPVHRNSVHRNSVHRNSVHRNSALRNSAHSNSVHRNSVHRNITPSEDLLSRARRRKLDPTDCKNPSFVDAKCVAKNITLFIVNPLIYLLFFAGFAFFIFAVIKYVLNGSEDSKKRKDSIKLIFFSLFGLFVVTTSYGIMKTLAKIGNGTTDPSVVNKIESIDK